MENDIKTEKDIRNDFGTISDRRDFLKLAALGTIASGAAIAPVGNVEAAEASPNSAGYQETEHVKEYYKTARF